MIQASVIVRTCGNASGLQSCLISLLSQSLRHDAYEVIVVPYGMSATKTTSTLTLADAARVRSLEPCSNLAAATNAGVAESKGAIILLLNEDCIPDPGLLQAHLELHEAEENILVQGPVLVRPECPRTAATKFEIEWRRRAFERSSTAPLHSSRFILRTNTSARECLLRKHPFREAAYSNVELAFRLHEEEGVKTRWTPAALVQQLYAEKASDLIADAAAFAQWEVQFAKVHPRYRSFSSIAKWNSDRIHKRAIRTVFARLPFSADAVLAPLFNLCGALRRFSFFPRLAVRILELRIRTASGRAAIAAAKSWRELHALFLQRVPILLYHHVSSDRDPHPSRFSMTQSRFERQMRWLAESGYQAIGLEKFLAWRESNSPLPQKPVLITFDDAYQDTAQYAFPVLERLGFPAVCMVVAGEQTNRWDAELGSKPLQLMNHEALQGWAGRGIDYGAHSCSHPDLRSLDPGRLHAELTGSRDQLEALIGSRVRTLAYPYGHFNDTVLARTAEVFDFAFTTRARPTDISTDALLLGRMEPNSTDSRFDLLSQVRWGWSPRLRLKGAVARLLRS